MKDNSSYAADSFQKVAAPQRRGSYGPSDNITGSYTQQGFDPSSSSREMRKIMYYENMFSKMDSQDKIKKTNSSSGSSSMNSSDHRAKDEADDNTKSPAKVGKHVNNNRKAANVSNSTDLDSRPDGMDHMDITDVSQGHSMSIEGTTRQHHMGPKRDAISIKIKTQNLNAKNDQTVSGSNENLLNGHEEKLMKTVPADIKKVTDISGTKISKMLGIDQIASSTSGLSASQRQWLVPTFDVRQPEQTEVQPADSVNDNDAHNDGIGASDGSQSQTESRMHSQRTSRTHMTTRTSQKMESYRSYPLSTSIGSGDVVTTEKVPRKQRVSRFEPPTEFHVAQAYNRTDMALVEPEQIKEEAAEPQSSQTGDMPLEHTDIKQENNDDRSFQDSDVQSYTYMPDEMDIIIHEQDMEIDSVSKDDIMDYEPVVKDDEDEEYIPEAAVQVAETLATKKTSRRRTKTKRSASISTPTIGTPTSDSTSTFDPVTPEVAIEEVYTEPTPVVRSTRSRASARSSGKQKKRDSNQLTEQDEIQPVAVKAPRTSRSNARSGPGSSRRNASDASGSKAEYHGSGHSICNETPDRHMKKAFANTRNISVEEAEKIIDLYQQHNSDLERLKRLILLGDLSEFGRIVIEEAETRTPDKTCIIDPRLIMAPPSDPIPTRKQDPPPQNPVELSLKYRLLKRLMNN
ncbi:hypothetical protein BaOVIS_008700 [Babesia ovis]|uniref:Uncharacterized protein n=1 Tax=Babesia ovis TaxID=5869 RepID=A0A9W5T9W9_BABOV|nr:hypothetical protein BaOVIS_008700 [Babesia ovis]